MPVTYLEFKKGVRKDKKKKVGKNPPVDSRKEVQTKSSRSKAGTEQPKTAAINYESKERSPNANPFSMGGKTQTSRTPLMKEPEEYKREMTIQDTMNPQAGYGTLGDTFTQ